MLRTLQSGRRWPFAVGHGRREAAGRSVVAIRGRAANKPAPLKGKGRSDESRLGASAVGVEKAPADGSMDVGDDITRAFVSLQQGSDVRGVAMDGIPGEDITLTPGTVFFIGAAFADWLASKLSLEAASLRVAVGRDPRLTGPLLRSSLSAGICSTGVTMADFGLASTPAMFMSTIATGYQYHGAIIITASHLPFNRNGLKFFTSEGGLDKPQIKELLVLAAQKCALAAVDPLNQISSTAHCVAAALALQPSLVKQLDFMPIYAAHLRSIIKETVSRDDNFDRPLEGFTIVVDAGNGAGGFFATDVLAKLGADISGSQFLDPDGTFPNHMPNPEDKEASEAVSRAVVAAGADLGIIFDTDVDRSGVVDESGFSITSNRMIALMSAITLREHPGSTIVTDSVTSNGLAAFISSLGGKHYRYRRGYKNVIGKGIELNSKGIDTHLMMETSGHGAVKENRFLDDGAYMAVKIVMEMVRRKRGGEAGIRSIIQDLKEPLEAKEYRINIKVPDFKPVALDATQRFHDFVEGGSLANWQLEAENHEGWRVVVDEGNGLKGWCLLRPSIHDPLCVLNVESEVEGGLKATTQQLMTFFTTVCGDLPLDLSPLEAVLNH